MELAIRLRGLIYPIKFIMMRYIFVLKTYSLKNLLLIVISLVSTFSVWGQQCSCEKKFAFIRHEIETNYAGYTDKVNKKTKAAYERLTIETLKKVRVTKKDAYCLFALKDWLDFFKDGHVQLFDPHQPDMNDTIAIRDRIKKTELIHLSPERVKQLENSTDHEEGIYYNFDSSYKIAIIKSKNEFRDYAGVIVDSKVDVWKQGQVKLELKKKNDSTYKAIAYMRDYSYRPQLYYFNGANLGGENWKKVNKPLPAVENKAYGQFHFQNVASKKLSDSTLYIQVGTFDPSNTHAIDSLFKATDTILKTTPNLILDLRSNGGGSDEAYASILPYIYTGPAMGYGNYIYATGDNIKHYEERLNDSDLSENGKGFIAEVISRMKQNPGKFVIHATDDTIKFDEVLPYPKKVVVLIDNNCASTTEEFLLAAKQSTKVTLMGQHTYGELDYSNWVIAPSPCQDIEFHYSTTKSKRIKVGKGIDGVGIKPDIVLSNDEDWISQARKYLEK